MAIDIHELDYRLPEELIAQEPEPRREMARMLVVDRARGVIEDRNLLDLPLLVDERDVVVANDTRAVASCVYARRTDGEPVEILLIEPEDQRISTWQAVIDYAGRVEPGEVLHTGPGQGVRLRTRLGPRRWIVEGVGTSLHQLVVQHGHMPRPHCKHRGLLDPRQSAQRARPGSVHEAGRLSLPAAGLRLPRGVFEILDDEGVAVAYITLHLGVGTLHTLRPESLAGNAMSPETYEIPQATVEAIRQAGARQGRVVAVGTPTVRALEASAADAADGTPTAGLAHTDLMITPGFTFRTTDCLLTNLHLPRSAPLALVAAFAGVELARAAYEHAVEAGYRFYAYGDMMFVM